MELQFRPYQKDVIREVGTAFSNGEQKILIVLPCGAGKTVLFAGMANASQKNGKTVWFLVHRKELLDQTIKTFERFGINLITIEIGMVATMANHLEKYPEPDFIIIDECFPKGTLIDGKDISEIKIGDYVNSYNHKTHKVERKKVVSISKKKPQDIVSVFLQNGKTLYCTSNHPIYTEKGYVQAKELKRNDLLYLWKGNSPRELHTTKLEIKSKNFSRQRENSLFTRMQQNQNRKHREIREKQNENERTQSESRCESSSKNFSDTKISKSQAENSRRKWERANRTTKNYDKPSRWHCRISYTYASKTWKRISELLQGRYCFPRKESSDRNRWFKPFYFRKESTRQKERMSFDITRVESVAFQKSTSDGTFGGLCSDGYVYNLEVEDNHNYFANGILVHNCQHSAAKQWLKIISAYPNAYLIGLTATPCRLDGKPLGEIYNYMIEGITAKELIQQGYLSQYRYFAPTVTDLSDLQRKGKDFNQEQATELLATRAVFGDVIKHYNTLAKGKQAICYCSSVRHSQATAEAFRGAGINAIHFDGNTPKAERDDIIEKFRNHEIQILCNVDLISEGFDVPDCECCILLRPTMSLSLFIQQSMRCMRPKEGKVAIILDHVNNYTRFGLPDDEREWSLTSKVKQRESHADDGMLKVRMCKYCFCTYESKLGKCPYCGAEYEATQQEIKNVKEIQLEEIKERKQAETTDRVKNYEKADECKSMAELVAFAKKKGYKPQWAYIQGKQRGWFKK